MNHSDDTDAAAPPVKDSARATQPAPEPQASESEPPGQSQTSEPRPATESPAPKPTPLVKTLPELVAAVYGKTRKQPKLSPKDLMSLPTMPPLSSEERSYLLSLAATDRTLDRTRMLLALSIERLHNTRLDGPVRDLVKEMLASHPAFQGPILNGVLRALPDAADEETAIRSLLSKDFDTLEWSDRPSPLKKGEVKQCRTNAVACLILWLYLSRGFSPIGVLRSLDAALWSPALSRKQNSERQEVTTLVAGRDVKALAVVCRLLEGQVREYKQSASTAREGEKRALKRAEKSDAKLAEASSQLAQIQATANALTEELKAERAARAADAAHARDDYQKLRGSVLQRIKEDVSLLDEGLQAIRRDNPKVHVMVDHAERVIQALRREMERLRGE